MQLVKRSMAALAGALCLSSAVMADGPVISLLMGANGESTPITLTGTATNMANVYNYSGSQSAGTGAFSFAWNFNASDSGAGNGMVDRAFTAGNFVVTNNSSDAIAFDILLSMPIALASPALYGGSVSAGLTTFGAGFLSDNDGAPLWAAYTGDTMVASLLNAPVSVARETTGSSAIGSDAFGQPIPSFPGPDFGSTLAIRLRFVISGGASASFTSVLVGQTVPAPGALALVGLGGLVAGSRRRRA